MKKSKESIPLFETDLNVVDLQGCTEADSETTLKNLEKPFTLICTFDCSTGFFDKSEYTLLKDEISKFKPAYVIFVATKLGNAIRDIQRSSQLEFDEIDIPLDVPQIIEKIKALMENS